MFVAVVPPPKATAELTGKLAPHRTRWPGTRWTEAASWHLTCSFMAHVDRPRHHALLPRLAEVAAGTDRFVLGLSRVGAFPAVEIARVLWVGVEPADELARLARRCRWAAAQAGIPVGAERFTGRLTLARFPRPTDARRPVAALADLEVAAWPVTELVLFESLLGRGDDNRPRYLALARFALSRP